ncbi:MAG: DmsE family decaheme c-type cytochrome [Nitrospinales bacterium]
MNIKNIEHLGIWLLTIIFLLCALPANAERQKINWGKINPNQKNSASTGNTTECLFCHGEYVKAFMKTKHAKAFKAIYDHDVGASCENCHGPLGDHLAEPGMKLDTNKVIYFKKIPVRAKNAICLQCHEQGQRMHWRGSQHEMMEVGCSDCHYVMKKNSKRRMLINEDPNKTCFQCHRSERAKIQRTSHMPIRTGKMQCTSCHNPHGGNQSLLKKPTINRTCFQCHQEKRGPMVWDHSPVRENCSTCHDPHGSNLGSLLKKRTPYLCQQCHMNVEHSSDLYSNEDLEDSFNGMFIGGKACLNCHSRIHGSNHPSGARFQR